MTTSKTDIKTQVLHLAADVFEAFCNNITDMFGVESTSCLSSDSNETIKKIEEKFKDLSAVITVKASGILNGDYYILFDKLGLFTLAGTVVMLPEEEIQRLRKNGSVRDAEDLYDAVNETGNLLVGAWDRIFHKDLQGHSRFLQTGISIGKTPDILKAIRLSEDQEFAFFPCQLTVGLFPAFSCGVIFPDTIFDSIKMRDHAEEKDSDKKEESPEDAAEQSEAENSGEPAGEPEVETPDTAVPQETFEEAPADGETGEEAGGAVSQTIRQMAQSLPLLPQEHAQALLSVCAKDVMNNEIIWGTPEDSVLQAMERMQQAGAACIMIGTRDALQGIVTWIDIAEAVSIYLRPVFSKWRRPEDNATLQIRVKIIMTQPVRTIAPQTSLAAIMEDMCRHRLRCLPVVSTEGKVQGAVTATDIFKALLRTVPDDSVTSAEA